MDYRMSDIVKTLNDATKAYDEGNPIMTDKEWDDLYFILQTAEALSGIYMADSPTQKIIYTSVNELKKVEHNHKMLSLAKTKDLDEVIAFIGEQPYLAMSKMDGLTCSLKYENGKLISAETRGNGLIGEDVLHNALVIRNIPKKINYTETLIVDGEIICTYEDFKEFEENYKNPRNFASGSIRLLDGEECGKRKLSFIAWDVIQGLDTIPQLSTKLLKLKELGFTTVPYIKGTTAPTNDLLDAIKTLSFNASYPIDGVVFKFDDIAYGRSLGETAHHFKNAIAFKFYDDVYETTLKEIEWTMGRTGVLTPVAVFESVDIDGSVIERASLHNVNIMTDLLGEQPWIGEPIGVFKANMIIPQVQWAKQEPPEGEEYTVLSPPTECPICGGQLVINNNEGVKTLVCSNPNCEGKLINILDHFCGKKGLDIKGLSKATLEKLIDWGWVNNILDIFKLKDHAAEWKNKPGFGTKSVDNILNAIENSKQPTLEAFIASLGIPLIGRTVAKALTQVIASYEELREKIDNKYDFSQIEGFADSKKKALLDYDYTLADEVYKLMNIQKEEQEEVADEAKSLNGMNIVITGKLECFKNRDELQKEIELRGGKVSGSVSKKTNILINNDAESESAKNVAAKKLGISVLTEQEFKDLFLDNL